MTLLHFPNSVMSLPTATLTADPSPGASMDLPPPFSPFPHPLWSSFSNQAPAQIQGASGLTSCTIFLVQISSSWFHLQSSPFLSPDHHWHHRHHAMAQKTCKGCWWGLVQLPHHALLFTCTHLFSPVLDGDKNRLSTVYVYTAPCKIHLNLLDRLVPVKSFPLFPLPGNISHF